MKKIIGNRFGIIQKTIIVLAVFAMSVVWPLGAFKVSHVSPGTWDGMRMSGPSNENEYVRQEFSPNFEQLEAISVYVCNEPDSFDTMKAVLRVYDYTGQCLSENFFQLEEQQVPGFVRIPVSLTVSPGTLYFYTIGGVDGDVIVAYCNDDVKTAENGMFFYKEVPAGGTSIVTGYEYIRPMGLKRILMADGLIAFVAAGLICALGFLRNRVSKDKWRKAEKVVRYVIAGITALGVLVAFYGIVIKRLFTDDVLNIVVLFTGVLIAAAWLLYAVFSVKSEMEPLAEGEQDVIAKAVRLIRSLLLAATLIMCCMYMNGGSNYEKGLFIRRIMTFFALFMISTGRKKQIFNLFTFLWTPVAFGIGKYYISLHSDHIEHIQTATRDAWVIWAIGLVVIHLIYRIKDGDFKRLKQISIPYASVLAVFWITCIVFANGRVWPAVLCVMFTLWSLFYLTSQYREELLEDICNGILGAFAGTTLFCLYRRPYQYYMLTRYAGIFFTVTVTATYYLIPAAAALVKALLARKEEDKKKALSAWLLYGVVAAYMSFTASRTGIITMAVMTLFALLVPFKGETKGFALRQLKNAGMMIVSMILMFVMAFSATRMVPAMAGNPFYFFFERPNAYFTAETPWKGGETKSATYIDVQMTLEMLFGRMFTVDEEEKEETARVEDCTEGPLLVSAEPVALNLSEGTAASYSNGRLEIFEAYLNQLNLNGHQTMSAVDADGKDIMHAHNSYLQVAFDFGIPTGIMFLIFCAFTFVRALRQAIKKGNDNRYKALPLFVIVGFGVASMFEWIYLPYNALGFAFLLVAVPLLVKQNRNCETQE